MAKPKQTYLLWSDDTDRFPDDHFLRSHGWRIAERPRIGLALWVNSAGVVMDEKKAVAHIVAFLRGDHRKK